MKCLEQCLHTLDLGKDLSTMWNHRMKVRCTVIYYLRTSRTRFTDSRWARSARGAWLSWNTRVTISPWNTRRTLRKSKIKVSETVKNPIVSIIITLLLLCYIVLRNNRSDTFSWKQILFQTMWAIYMWYIPLYIGLYFIFQLFTENKIRNEFWEACIFTSTIVNVVIWVHYSMVGC